MATLLSRSQESDFIRLEGLQKLTNVTAHDWDLYILKELVDNALDADETIRSQIGSPHITVEMTYDRQHESEGLKVTVRNKAKFPIPYIEQLFDLNKRVSVKDYYNYPTRGAQGNALKTILGIPYALQYRYFSDYSVGETPLSITYADRRIELWLEVDELNQTVSLRKEEKTEEDEVVDETTITVGISRFIQKQPRTIDELTKLARSFALFNPHAILSFQFVFIQKNGKYIFKEFSSQGDPTWNSKYDLSQPAPIYWYSYPEFRELLHAMILRAREYKKASPTLQDVAAEFGIIKFPMTDEFSGVTSLETLLKGTSLDFGKTNRLYKLFTHQAEGGSVPFLGEIGSKFIMERSQIPGGQNDESRPPLFFYRHHMSEIGKADIEPFVLEVALSSNDEQKRQVIVGINHTPTYQDPFFNKPLVPPGSEEPYKSLEKLLEFYKLEDTRPITLTVHLIAPNVEYENYGKSAISDEPYRDVLTQLIHEVVQEYEEATRIPEPLDYLSEPAQNILPQAIDMLTGTDFSENQLLYALKRLLLALNDENVAADLTTSNADTRLRTIISNRHHNTPIRGLFKRPSGRLAVPRHPRDSINIFFGELPLLDIVRQFQMRSVIVTNRPELEELLIAQNFPVLYDLAVLRADGNLKAAVELLVYRMKLAATDEKSEDQQTLPSIWIVRDATIEDTQLVKELTNLVRERGLPPECIVDLGLHPDDLERYEGWRDKAAEPISADRSSLKALGFSAAELEFYLDNGYSARLDSLPPQALVHWFEMKLTVTGEGLKALPSAEHLIGLTVEELRDRFRRIVAKVAFDNYSLEDVQQKLVERWRKDMPDWGDELHKRLTRTLQNDPHESWQHLLESALDEMMEDYITGERLTAIKQMMPK